MEIEDKIPLTPLDKERMFVDILPETDVDDGVAYISFYLEEEEDAAEILSKAREELNGMSAYVDVGECTFEESQTEDLDWINNWKQYFHQFCVDDILIIPSWEEVKPEDSEKMIIHIDPGTAFGTGMHETTQALYPAASKVCDRWGAGSRCRMRERNFGDAGIEVRGRTLCGDRPGSLRH